MSLFGTTVVLLAVVPLHLPSSCKLSNQSTAPPHSSDRSHRFSYPTAVTPVRLQATQPHASPPQAVQSV